MTDPRDLIQQLADAYAYCIDKYMTAPSEEDSLVSKARAYLENTKPQERISNEVIRIDLEGFHYNGQFIADAGEAHRLFIEFLRQNNPE